MILSCLLRNERLDKVAVSQVSTKSARSLSESSSRDGEEKVLDPQGLVGENNYISCLLRSRSSRK